MTSLSRAIPPNHGDKAEWKRAALGKRKEGTEPPDAVLDSTVRLREGWFSGTHSLVCMK